jgi:hypothetical protein
MRAAVRSGPQNMNANDVLIDLFEDNRRRLHRVFDDMSDDCIVWKPDADANSIAITVWHMARILDVFLTQQAKGHSSAEEIWFRRGWAEQTGYDPRGLGQNGWGMLTGFSQEDVATMPQLSRAQLLGYLNDVYDTTEEFLASRSIAQLLSSAPGFEGRYSVYQCVQMALLDNARHLGEVFAIQARWHRHEKQQSMGRPTPAPADVPPAAPCR